MVKNIFPRTTEGRVYWAFAILLWLYVLLRAIFMPLVHDEVATFFHYIQSGEIFPPNAHWDANNHLLNSLLSRGSFLLFGSEPWALRLPNVLSFALYLMAVRKMSLFVPGVLRRWSLIIGLTGVQFFLDYFSLTRGYGLSLAFLMTAIWLLMKLRNEYRTTYVIWAMVLSILACMANLSLLIMGLSVWGLVTHNLILRFRSHRPSPGHMFLWPAFILSGVWGWKYLIDYSFSLKEKNLLYYGGDESFYEVTLTTLSENLFPDGPQWLTFILAITGLTVFALYIANQVHQKKWFHRYTYSDIPVILLVVNVIAIVAMHYLLGVKYPEDRTAIHILVLLVPSLVFVAKEFKASEVLIALPLFFLIQLPIRANFSHTIFWKNEQIPSRFFEQVEEWQEMHGEKATMAGYFGRWLGWTYVNYQNEHRLDMFNRTNYPQDIADFQIVQLDRHRAFWLKKYDVLDSDEATGLSLIRRKVPLKSNPIDSFSLSVADHEEEEYINLYDDTIYLDQPTNYEVGVEMVLESKDLLKAWIVVEARGKDTTFYYDWLPFDWVRNRWDSNELDVTFQMYKLPSGIHRVLVYVWNRRKQPFRIKEGSISLTEVESLLYSGEVKQ